MIRGAYGMLRSAQGWVGDEIIFSGLMTMIGINCEWRMTWTEQGRYGWADHPLVLRKLLEVWQ